MDSQGFFRLLNNDLKQTAEEAKAALTEVLESADELAAVYWKVVLEAKVAAAMEFSKGFREAQPTPEDFDIE